MSKPQAQPQPTPVIYDNDTRYSGPLVHPPPAEITGMPTQSELDAQARMFTWGELKEIVHSGDLELLMRNKRMQARYDTWMVGMKQKFGSTEAYLTQARLPWSSQAQANAPVPTFDLHLDPLPPRAPSASSPMLEPPSPSSPQSYPYPPPPMSPKGEPSPNLRSPIAGTGLSLNVDVPHGGQGELLKPRHGRTPSITISPSEPTPPQFLNPVTVPVPAPAPAATPVSPALRATSTETPGGAGSGISTPSSVGFVSLSSLNLVNGKLRRSNPGTPTKQGSGSSTGQKGEPEGEEEDDEGEEAEYLRWEGWLDGAKYAVLPNDWPYNVPYGVRHYCVWSRIPIAHPDLVDYSPEAWSKIESEGLGGFTGVTPLYRRRAYPTYTPASASPSPPDPDSGFTSPVNPNAGRTKNLGHLAEDEWYAVDVDYSGGEKKKWAGREYEAKGGKEVGRMVKGLWDERGWECLWFVNPPRLQSVPGFSHFHVFARRKTPEEIDAAEAAVAAAARKGLKADGESVVPPIKA